MDGKQFEKVCCVSRQLPRRSPRFNPLARQPEVNKLNDTQMNINCLPEEILIVIFKCLTQNELGRIARVCKRWFQVTRSPVLWKKVDIWFHWSQKYQNIVAEKLLENLPSCVTHLKLDFRYFRWKKPLKFEEFCAKLGEKCPSLKALILHFAQFSINVQSVLDLSRQYLQNVEILSLHQSTFTDYSVKAEYVELPKLKILDLDFNYGIKEDTSKLTLSKMSSLKKLNLFHTGVNTSWFTEDTSFLRNLEVLNVCAAFNFNSRFFEILRNCAMKLIELYLCRTNLKDSDFGTRSPMFPQLKSMCLRGCNDVTCEGVVTLVRYCKSLQNVYVDANVAENYKQHPFVVANNSKLKIVKTIDRCLHLSVNKKIDYLYE